MARRGTRPREALRTTRRTSAWLVPTADLGKDSCEDELPGTVRRRQTPARLDELAFLRMERVVDEPHRVAHGAASWSNLLD